MVVDNSEDEAEARYLRQGLPAKVYLEVNPQNIGFGCACNQAVRGYRGDAILLLNPDARLLPGCLKRIQETLFSVERAGAVSSRIYWDSEFKFMLPSSYPRALLEIQALFKAWPPQAFVNRVLSTLWRYHSIKVWRAQKPIRVTNLSGSMVLLKVSAVERAGGLFDPRFFLYFEDTDLFIRLRKAGYSLFVEPRAQAIHYYDQCGGANLKYKRSLMVRSHQLFLQKHGSNGISRLWRDGHNFRFLKIEHPHETRGPDFAAPFSLNIPVHLQKGWLFEWSPLPTLLPAVGRFGTGPIMEFPKPCWEMLAQGQYFGRIGSRSALGKTYQVISWIV